VGGEDSYPLVLIWILILILILILVLILVLLFLRRLNLRSCRVHAADPISSPTAKSDLKTLLPSSLMVSIRNESTLFAYTLFKDKPMPTKAPVNLWTSAGHAGDYLAAPIPIPNRGEGESTLLEFIPAKTQRVLDLGTGDGRLLALVKAASTAKLEAVAVDFSPAMLSAAGERFAGDSSITIVNHNLDHPLPILGKFDAVVSSFAIHHLVHERKRELYTEILRLA